MTQFHLKIVTPDGLRYDGMAESLTVRTASGDLGILARHLNCVAPLGMGEASVVLDGKHDDIPESCFLFAGTIEDVVNKARGGEQV